MVEFIRSRLQLKLILAFVLVLLIPTAIIAFYSISTTTGILAEKTRDDQLKSARRTAVSIENFLGRARSDVLMLSQAAPVSDYLAARDVTTRQQLLGNIRSFFLSYARNVPIYSQIVFIDRSGHELAGAALIHGKFQAIPDADLQDQSATDYFKGVQSLSSGDIFVSKVGLNKINGQIEQPEDPLMYYAAPIFDDQGVIQGVVATALFTRKIYSSALTPDPNLEVTIIDEDGTYLYGPDESQLFGRDLQSGANFNKDHPDDAKQIFSSPEVVLFGSKEQPDSLQIFIHISPFDQDTVQWILYTRSIDNVPERINNTRQVIIVLSLIAALIAIGVALFITRGIVRPVQALTHSAIAISNGDISQNISLSGHDEIGSLARAFNKMSQELSISYIMLEKRVEERTAQLAAAQRRAEEASRAKSVFLSNMSHELRTPLNVIIGYSSSMLDVPMMYNNVPLPNVYEDDVRLVLENGDYLLGLINDILDLSKIEEGRLDLHLMSVDLRPILSGILSTSVGLIKDKPIQLRADFPENLPLIWVDPMRVRQIILNLVSNAIKFTQVGSVTLQASVEDSYVRISVNDTGIGIPEKALTYIFDRYRQAEHSIERHYGGTGLGLDISKQLCEMQGGQLSVFSQVGQGSTFTASLPIATPAQIQEKPAANSTYKAVRFFAADSYDADTTYRVMLVENDVALRNAVKLQLENQDFVVIDSDDAQKAFQTTLSLLPEFVVLDTPGAFQFLEFMKAEARMDTIHVILCVAASYRGPEDEHIHYLLKPITPDDVLIALQTVLSKQSLLRKDA